MFLAQKGQQVVESVVMSARMVGQFPDAEIGGHVFCQNGRVGQVLAYPSAFQMRSHATWR